MAKTMALLPKMRSSCMVKCVLAFTLMGATNLYLLNSAAGPRPSAADRNFPLPEDIDGLNFDDGAMFVQTGVRLSSLRGSHQARRDPLALEALAQPWASPKDLYGLGASPKEAPLDTRFKREAMQKDKQKPTKTASSGSPGDDGDLAEDEEEVVEEIGTHWQMLVSFVLVCALTSAVMFCVSAWIANHKPMPELELTDEQRRAEQEWLQDFLTTFWPQCDAYARKAIQENIAPNLKGLKGIVGPVAMEVSDVGGPSAVKLSNIQAHEIPGGSKWLQTKFSYQTPIAVVLSAGAAKGAIKSVKLAGELVVKLESHMDKSGDLSVIDAAIVYFLHPPEVEFEFSGLEGERGQFQGAGLDKAILAGAKEFFKKNLVLTHEIRVPLSDGGPGQHLSEKPQFCKDGPATKKVSEKFGRTKFCMGMKPPPGGWQGPFGFFRIVACVFAGMSLLSLMLTVNHIMLLDVCNVIVDLLLAVAAAGCAISSYAHEGLARQVTKMAKQNDRFAKSNKKLREEISELAAVDDRLMSIEKTMEGGLARFDGVLGKLHQVRKAEQLSTILAAFISSDKMDKDGMLNGKGEVEEFLGLVDAMFRDSAPGFDLDKLKAAVFHHKGLEFGHVRLLTSAVIVGSDDRHEKCTAILSLVMFSLVPHEFLDECVEHVFAALSEGPTGVTEKTVRSYLEGLLTDANGPEVHPQELIAACQAIKLTSTDPSEAAAMERAMAIFVDPLFFVPKQV